MKVFIVLHLLFQFAWLLLVLLIRCFIELLLVGIFCILPSGVWRSVLVALEFFLFSDLCFVFLPQSSF